MPGTMRLEIVTPEAVTYAQQVEMVTLPGVDGEMGVYPMHVPLMTQVVPGEVVVRKDGKELYLVVGEGFVQITGDRVAILTDMAFEAGHIDEAQAEEAKRRAEARLQEKLSAEEVASVSAALAQSIAQLNVKRRRRPGA